MPALTHSSNNTPSLRDAPSESGHTSASVLARGSDAKWTDWQEHNKRSLDDGIRNIREVDAFWNESKCPCAVKDKKIVRWMSFHENDKINRMRLGTEFMTYEEWASTLKKDEISVEDPFKFATWYSTLFTHWHSHLKASARSANEYAKRKGVDNMIELAFDQRIGAKHTYLPEAELALPKSPWTAKASAITVIDLPFDWVDFLQSLPNSHVFKSYRAALTIPTFVFEAKQKATKSGSRQLTLYFCFLQHQRRALGFKDGPIFGATLVGSMLSLYVSVWRKDKIAVNATGISYYLKSLPAFVMCYLFLCKLSEYISQEVNKEVERWKTDSGKQEITERNSEASANPWRPKYHPKPPSGVPRKRSCSVEDDAQDAQESDEREELNEREPEIATMISSIENGDPAPIGGYPLIMKRLFAHDIYCKNHPSALDASVVKDIRGWARQSSNGQLDKM